MREYGNSPLKSPTMFRSGNGTVALAADGMEDPACKEM